MRLMVPTQNVRTPVSQVPGVGKKDALYLWSTARFDPGASAGSFINIFQTQQGNPGQGFATGLTSRETNVTQNPGQVPLDQRWECFDIGVEWLAANGDGVSTIQASIAAQLQSKLQLEFVRGQTQTIQLGPCALYDSGSGVYGGLPATNIAGNGLPSIGARRRLGRSLVLNPGDTWFMRIVVADADGLALVLTGGAETDVRVSLWMYRDLGLSG